MMSEVRGYRPTAALRNSEKTEVEMTLSEGDKEIASARYRDENMLYVANGVYCAPKYHAAPASTSIPLFTHCGWHRRRIPLIKLEVLRISGGARSRLK